MIIIPLTLLGLPEDGFQLLVEVVVYNQRFKAVLDTGASKTVFDKTTMEQHVNQEHIKLIRTPINWLGHQFHGKLYSNYT